MGKEITGRSFNLVVIDPVYSLDSRYDGTHLLFSIRHRIELDWIFQITSGQISRPGCYGFLKRSYPLDVNDYLIFED